MVWPQLHPVLILHRQKTWLCWVFWAWNPCRRHRCAAPSSALALPGLLPSPASLGKPWRPGNAAGGAGGSDHLRRMVIIPSPLGQARGNTKGLGQ